MTTDLEGPVEDRVPFADIRVTFDDEIYVDRIRRGVYGMYTHTGNAAVAAMVAAVRAAIAGGQLLTPEAIRRDLGQRHTALAQDPRFPEARDSEVRIHLKYEFDHELPDDDSDRVAWGWLYDRKDAKSLTDATLRP